jgi:hypothetical protein
MQCQGNFICNALLNYNIFHESVIYNYMITMPMNDKNRPDKRGYLVQF